jgi:hypothetical protein
MEHQKSQADDLRSSLDEYNNILSVHLQMNFSTRPQVMISLVSQPLTSKPSIKVVPSSTVRPTTKFN